MASCGYPPVQCPAPGRHGTSEGCLLSTHAPGSGGDCARQIVTSLARRCVSAPRHRADVATLRSSIQRAPRCTFDEGIELACRLLASPQFLVRAEKEPATVRAVRPTESVTWNWRRDSRSSLEQHSRRRAADAGEQGRLSTPRTLERRYANAGRPALRGDGQQFAQQLLYLRNLPATRRWRVLSGLDDELRKASAVRRSCSSTASCARTAASSIC